MKPGDERQSTAADYSRALERGVAWLNFEPAMEAEFRHSHALRVRPQARFWQLFQLIVAALAIRLVLDYAPQGGARNVLLACNAVHVVVSLALVASAFSRFYLRSYQVFAATLTPFRAASFAIIVAAIIDAGASGTAALTIDMFGLMFFSGLLLRQALPSAIVICIAFLAALTAFGVEASLAAYSSTSLLVVFGLAAFVAWDMQRASRQAFLEHGVTRADATRDALTGLVNRRHFDRRLEALWGASGQAARPLTVMLVDVDHFKAYNDGYGHLAGDEALRRVAQAMHSVARSGNVVARFGGEEMAILATDLTNDQAAAFAGKLRAAVEALAIPHAGAPGTGIVTVSIGGACLVPFPGRSPSGALQLADENLYAAKRNGRNRVVFHADRPPEA